MNNRICASTDCIFIRGHHLFSSAEHPDGRGLPFSACCSGRNISLTHNNNSSMVRTCRPPLYKKVLLFFYSRCLLSPCGEAVHLFFHLNRRPPIFSLRPKSDYCLTPLAGHNSHQHSLWVHSMAPRLTVLSQLVMTDTRGESK